MSSTINAIVSSGVAVTETFSGADAGNPDASFGGDLAETPTLNATSTPAATKKARFDLTLSSGTGTIDLTALPGNSVDETINGTGLKVQVLKFRNKSTNANKITVAKGGTNGYQLDGATTWSDPMAPGQSSLRLLNGAADTIGSTKKTIDVTGTGSQVLQVLIVLG